jgi:hypothetical protein
MSDIYEVHGDPYEVGGAVFTFLTHVAYLRVSDSERADDIAEQVMTEEVPRIGAHGFTSGYAIRMLRRVKELSEQG